MKRKQLSLTEAEFDIIVDALHTQWWIKYDPDVENTVQAQHKLFQRVIDARSSFSSGNA